MATKNKPYTMNRDQSWLMFNQRVLDEARDASVPLFERIRFLSIFKNNMDEFFMIRIGSQFDILNIKPDAVDWRSDRLLRDVIRSHYRRAQSLFETMENTYAELVEELSTIGIHLKRVDELSKDERKLAEKHFKSQIAPILSPQVIDAMHPFPHIQNDKMHIGLVLKRKSKRMYGIIPIPQASSPFIMIKDQLFLSIEDVVYNFSPDIFHMYEVEEKMVFHLYRNADLNFDEEYYDDSVNLKLKMKQLLQRRNQLFPVRIDVSIPTSGRFIKFIQSRIEAKPFQFMSRNIPLAMGVLNELIHKDVRRQFPQHSFPPFQPRVPEWFTKSKSMMALVEQQDVFLHYPYDSMEPFLRLIYEAAMDRHVVSIKITIYRLAKTAKLIEYLALAAEQGKEILVIMELRARFDEQNNIDWSERLERAGCKIVYGLDVYKVHSKICLITKTTKQGLMMITQVGTGNYNEVTVEQYTDMSIITANPTIGMDAAQFFTNISIGSAEGQYEQLIISPFQIKKRLLALIEREKNKGELGYIRFKINALTDRDLIEELVKASQAGVTIEMITRSISCLRPRVRGWTSSITVISIVGRFLEHARVYQFGQADDLVMYLSSADLMTRNMERRIEVALPVLDSTIQSSIQQILNRQWADNVKARRLNSKGRHVEISEVSVPFNSQDYFIENDI